jgi:hypothetical protein
MLVVSSVAMLFVVMGVEYTNAYANATSPGQPTYVRVDDAYVDCYRFRHGKEADRSLQLPVLTAFQRHTAADALWLRTSRVSSTKRRLRPSH